jgi:hypothetical protein
MKNNVPLVYEHELHDPTANKESQKPVNFMLIRTFSKFWISRDFPFLALY